MGRRGRGRWRSEPARPRRNSLSAGPPAVTQPQAGGWGEAGAAEHSRVSSGTEALSERSQYPLPLYGTLPPGSNPPPPPRVVLKPKEERRLLGGHRWVFSNEVREAPTGLTPGEIVELYTHSGRCLGVGFYHPHSLIRVRLLSTAREPITPEWFERRLRHAWACRQRFLSETTALRVVYGESDDLPGLILDRYDRYLVLQILSAGMERQLPVLLEACERIFQPAGVVLKNDIPLRTLEGLPLTVEVARGTVPELVRVQDRGLTLWADLVHGQKTGLFLDQRENHQMVKRWCAGARVFDGFCYVGAFGLTCGQGGAREVLGVDRSAPAIQVAQRNAEANGLQGVCRFIVGDVEEALSQCAGAHEKFDIIGLDPPAFARSRSHVPAALKGYEKLNTLALACLKEGGLLLTSSCSHHVERERFLEMLRRAAQRAGRRVQLWAFRTQAPDHPILLSMPETEYLKCALLHVV